MIKLIHFLNKSTFDSKLSELSPDSIAFIKDTHEIWTHGLLYHCSLSLEEINALLEDKANISDLSNILGEHVTDSTTLEPGNKILLKERGTNENLYPITSVNCIVDFGEILYNIVTYGVAWKPNVADPILQRVGNMEYHKTLPIQSSIKGCIYRPKENKLIKWLNLSNWNKRSSYENQSSELTGTAKFEFALGTESDIFIEGEDVMETALIYDNEHLNSRYPNQTIGIPNFPADYNGKICISGIAFQKFFADEINKTTQGIDLNPVALKGMEITLVNGTEEFTYKVLEVLIGIQGQTSATYNPNNFESYNAITLILDTPDLEVTTIQKLISATSFKVEECLNGYYGEVMVYVPEFYIRSWDEEDRREVRICKYKVDDTWEHQPATYIGAYKDTVLNTVPANMGYLSTLEANSAICVVNDSPYCRGGNNAATWDNDPIVFRRNLNKGRTNISRSLFRTYERKAGKEILSYRQYKNILYWLWVIEYANFNSQARFIPELTSEGFRLGGMGVGITVIPVNGKWARINGRNPLTPNGYTNEFGNGTIAKDLVIPKIPLNVPAINNFQSVYVNSAFGSKIDGKIVVTNIPNTNTFVSIGWNSCSVRTTYRVTGLTDETLIFVSNGISYGEISTDGTIEVNWPQNLNARLFKFDKVKSDVNITIEVVSSEAGIVFDPSITFSAIRWRGLENNFGDTWHNLDGIITALGHPSGKLDGMDFVYTTDDPALYGDDDTNLSLMKKALVPHTSGMLLYSWIIEWDLGNTSEIIPRSGNNALGGPTKYKCDRYTAGRNATCLTTCLIGGSTEYGDMNGLVRFNVSELTNVVYSDVGFRSACIAK